MTAKWWAIRDFSPGQNNEYNPRNLQPNVEEEAAESVKIENYDLTNKGSIITSPGHELILDLGNAAKGQHIGTYNVDTDNRYLIAVADDKVYKIDKSEITTLHNCDSIADWALEGTGDEVNLTLDTTTKKFGTGSLNFDITVAGTANDYAGIVAAAMGPVDISDYVTDGYILGWFSIPATTNFSSITFRWGTDASNHWTQTVTAGVEAGNPDNSTGFVAGWNALKFDFTNATQVGSPNSASIVYLWVRYNYAGGYVDQTDARVDNLKAFRDVTDYQAELIHTFTNASTHINGVPFAGSNSQKWYALVGDGGDEPQKIEQVSSTDLQVVDMDPTSGSTLVDGYIVEEMMGFLFIVIDRTIYYCASEDETDFAGGGAIGVNSRVLGLKKTANKSIIVLMEDNQSQEITFSFDDTSYTYTPVVDDFMLGIGGISHKTTQQVYDDTLFLSREGVKYFGQDAEYASDNFRINTLSWKIDPLIQEMNYSNQEKAASFFFDKEYGLAIPVGDAFPDNNQLFVYDYRHNSWKFRSGINAADFTVFRESLNEELYFIGSTEDKVYRFVTDDYSYDGTEYKRSWKSKVFNFGTSIIRKRIPYIEVAGSMPEGSEFYVTVTMDSEESTFKIDDSALAEGVGGGYIGDDVYGNEFFGGDLGESPYAFFRYYQRIPLPQNVMEGHEFQIEVWYEGEGRPHKLDFINIKYEFMTEQKVPDNFINNNIIV